MKIRRPTTKRAKRTPRRRGLALSDSVLRLFPKTSRMGSPEPSQWGMAGGHRPRVTDSRCLSVAPPTYS